MSDRIVVLLQEVARRLQRPATSEQEGLAALQLTTGELAAALRHHVVTADLKPRLQGAVLEVAAALSQFAPAATAALSRSDALAHLPSFLGTAHQVTAGCAVLFYCGNLAEGLDLSDTDAFRLAAAAQLALAAGPLVLARLREASRGAANARPASLAADNSPRAAAQAHREALHGVLHGTLLQLFAVGSAMGLVLHPSSRPQTAAAFAASTARPAALLPWLRAMSTALRAAPPPQHADCSQDSETVYRAHFYYVTCVELLLCSPCWSPHGDAVAADPALLADVADVLLLHCLPALAAACANAWPPDFASPVADQLQGAVTSRRLKQAVQRLLQQEEASAQVAATLSSLVAAMPQQLDDGEAGVAQCALLCASWTLGAACVETASVGGAAQRVDASTSPDGGDGSGAAGSRVPAAAAWLQLTLQAVPRLQALLQQRYDSFSHCWPDGEEAFHRMLEVACNNLGVLLHLLEGERLPLAACSAWLDAAAAGLRLQPRLTRLRAVFQRLPPGERLPNAAQYLSQQLLEVVVYGAVDLWPPMIAWPDAEPGAREAAQGARAQLLQLHSLACRLCHWLASGGEGARLAAYSSLDAVRWRWIEDNTNAMYVLAAVACEARPLELCNSPETRALCVSQLAAMQAAQAAYAAAAAAPAASDGHRQRCAASLVTMLTPLSDAGRLCPAIVDSSFLKPAHAALAPLAQDESEWLALTGLLSGLLNNCSTSPRLACSAVSTGLLAMAVECAGRDAAAADPRRQAAAADLLVQCACCLACITGRDGPVGSDASADVSRQVAAAFGALRHQLALLLIMPAPATAARCQLLRQLLQPAEQAAAAFDAYCRQPSQQEAAQLEMARAAAGRSCAYLRCHNVQAEGGALAREGVGSMRCSACRAVWYCGTACSHADWREGGHRRVCKLLGEERQRRKAARQQG